MAMRIVTVNQFVQVYRKHSGETVSVEHLMSNPAQAARLAQQALVMKDTTLQALAKSLLDEIGGVAPAPRAPVSAPAPAPSAPAASPASASLAPDPVWDAISAAAREVSGPMGGAIVSKFRKENPGLTPDQAIPRLREKLGDAGPEFARLCKK